MSAKSIAAYQRHTGKVPPLEDRLRDLVGKIRRRAAADLAMSNDLEAIANELAAPKVLAAPEPTCDCNTVLTFETRQDGFGKPIQACHCPRCKNRCEFGTGVTFVYGYGHDKGAALANWRSRMDSF